MSSVGVVDLARVRRLTRSGEAKRIRERAGLTLGEVAGAVGVSPATVLRWERDGQEDGRTPRGAKAVKYGRLLERLSSEVLSSESEAEAT